MLNSVSLNRRTFAAITAISLMAPALWAQPRLEKTKITIAVGGKAALCFLPLTVAEQLGYFKAEGLDVEISDFSDGVHAMLAGQSGRVDVVSGSFENTISLQSRGHMFQAFVLQNRAPAIAMGIATKSTAQIRSVAELKGKTIGISAHGSTSHTVAQLMLSRAGLKPGVVIFVDVGMAAGALSAWHSGLLDAMSNVDPVMTLLEQKGEIRLVADSRTLKGSVDLFGGVMPAACLYAPVEFIQKHPKTVQALTNALVHALKWLQTAGPSDLMRTVPEAYLLGDRALYLTSFDKVRSVISPDGMMFEGGPPNALKVLASLDSSFKAENIEIGATYTNDFASLAKLKFKA